MKTKTAAKSKKPKVRDIKPKKDAKAGDGNLLISNHLWARFFRDSLTDIKNKL
jgi:hypothetical protein